MSVFNFMETFFFISLGITFILILLLVYHFKQRLSAIEQKSDTMFDIINNVVQELTTIKTFVVANMAQSAEFNFQVPTSYIPQSVYESQSTNGTFSQNEVLENHLDDHEESSEESGSEVDTDSDDEEEHEDSDDEKIMVSDNESESNVKVVNIPITMNEEILDISEEHESESMTEENDLVESVPELVEDPIVVHKLESSDETLVVPPAEEKEDEPASYAKLSTAELKKLVISKGLATEVGKMKKTQLVHLLESGISE
jgi:hypothetical protein